MADYLKDLITRVKKKKGEEISETPERLAHGFEREAPETIPEKKPLLRFAAKKPAEIDVMERRKPPEMPPAAEGPLEGLTEEKPAAGAWEIGEAAQEGLPAKGAEGMHVETGPEEITEAEKSAIEEEMERAEKIEIASYGDIKIYKVRGQPLLYYWIPVPRASAAEKAIISTIKEAATRIISIAPYKIRDPKERENAYYNKIMEILRESTEMRIPKTKMDFYAGAVVRDMIGYGIIDPLIKDDRLEEIMVIGANKPVYVFHRDYEMMITNIEFYSEKEIQDLINKIARQIGRRVDMGAPLLDARLPDGSRVNATIPPASVNGSTLTIRKFREDPYSIVDIIKMNTMSIEVAAFLWMCVEGMGVSPANLLISGGTGSGKTTTLNVLAAFIPESERIVSIEDTAELNLPLKHWIRLEAKPPGLEGTGELTLDVLTKNSLRMRPDRIIVGEVRHQEAFSLFTAMNTGHDGCMGTVHANSPQEAIVRVTSPPMNVPEVMLSGLDFILVEHRIHDKKKGTIRRITEIAEVSGVLEGKATTQVIYERDAPTDTLKRTNIPVAYLNGLQKLTGFSKKQIEAEWLARKRVLKNLVDNNIRSMAEVSRACQAYLEERGKPNAEP